MIEALAAAGFAQLALSPHGLADIRDVPRASRMALYLGTEGEGLPQALMQRLSTVRIAIADGFDSLNVAAASAIALHEIRNR
jgi:tRNA G18 (ribose-2'-O)-methylase SpoU